MDENHPTQPKDDETRLSRIMRWSFWIAFGAFLVWCFVDVAIN